MSRKILTWFCLGATAVVPVAFAQEAGMVRVIAAHVQFGHQQHYESVIPRMWEAFEEAGVTGPIFVSSGVSEPDVYTFVVPVASFAQLDANQAATSKAFASAGDVVAEIQGMTTGVDQSIWAMRPDLGYAPETPRVAETEAGFTHATFLYPHPGKALAFEGIIKEASELRKKHGITDAVAVGQLVIGDGGPAYAVIIDAKDQADYYAHAAKVAEKMGEDWQALIAKAGPMLKGLENQSWTPRPDLAYQP